jgi:cytochrome c-type biogenesis protein CcmH/NrfG
LHYLPIAASRLTIGAIEVTPLSAGGAAVLPLRMQSKRGVDEKTAAPLANQIRAVAAQYPDDPLVQVTLAEAEHDAGNLDAAWAAAERALKANPKSTEAMIYKGRVMMGRAEKSGTDADWKEARRWLLAANKLDTEDPEPLMLFYETYVRQGERPTANAIAALHYASRLAPQDGGLRMTSAMAFLNERKLDEARLEIAPIAFDPHGGDVAATARQVLDFIAKGDVNSALGIRSQEAKAGGE